MRQRLTLRIACAATLASMLHVTALLTPASAEPVIDRALSGLDVAGNADCTLVKISFNFRIRYTKHFPLEQGQELRVSLQPIDHAQAAALSLLKREALRAPAIRPIGITAIDFEASTQVDPLLRIQFDAPAAYRVGPGPDFESLIIAISGRKPSAKCLPIFPADVPAAWNTRTVEPARNGGSSASGSTSIMKMPGHGTATAAQTRQAAGSMDEGRAALRKGSYDKAAAIFNSVIALPPTEFTAEALEMLGVAYQKDGKTGDARQAYETYLARNTSGEGPDRVRQRLAGIAPANEQPSHKNWGHGNYGDGASARKGPAETTWSMSGSVSEFYYRDDSYRVVQDPSLPFDINADKDAHQVHRNVLMSTFDLFAAWNNPVTKNKFRFSGTEEHSFNPATISTQDIIAISALSLETTNRDLNLMTRLGRQTRNGGGVIGRFDGAVASWQATPTIRLNAVTGSPVERRKDAPFLNDKYFYGASIDFGAPGKGLETSLFAIRQMDRMVLDREAVGAELRYVQPDKFAFATVDYDVHYSTLNAAVINGSWTLPDKSTIHGALDYRKAPYLSAWTALQSQPFLTLYDMLKLKTKEEIDQLAIDRTASYKSATVGFSKPLSDKVIFSLDGTATNISGTVASGGVDATLSPGTDYYVSAQLAGTNLVYEGDNYNGGLRYANRPESNLYVLDLSARFPVTKDLQVGPRLRLGYEAGTTVAYEQITTMPSVLFNYALAKDLNFELETGTQWTARRQEGVRTSTTDFFFTVGIRYDFNLDGRSNCTTGSWMCR